MGSVHIVAVVGPPASEPRLVQLTSLLTHHPFSMQLSETPVGVMASAPVPWCKASPPYSPLTASRPPLRAYVYFPAASPHLAPPTPLPPQDGRSALHVACGAWGDAWEVAELLLQHPQPPPPHAAAHGRPHAAAVRSLLDARCAVSLRSTCGMSTRMLN